MQDSGRHSTGYFKVQLMLLQGNTTPLFIAIFSLIIVTIMSAVMCSLTRIHCWKKAINRLFDIPKNAAPKMIKELQAGKLS